MINLNFKILDAIVWSTNQIAQQAPFSAHQ